VLESDCVNKCLFKIISSKTNLNLEKAEQKDRYPADNFEQNGFFKKIETHEQLPTLRFWGAEFADLHEFTSMTQPIRWISLRMSARREILHSAPYKSGVKNRAI
jgi:hypothetical protein